MKRCASCSDVGRSTMRHLAITVLWTLENPVPVLQFSGAFLQQWPSAMRQAAYSAQLVTRGGVEEQIRYDRCETNCLVDI